MSIELHGYRCRMCQNKAELPYIKLNNVFEKDLHLCSQRCFKLFQMILGQKAKIYNESNRPIKKKVTFEKDG